MPRGKRETYMLWRGFQKPKRLAVDAETLTETFGKFSAQPFERGFGTTIGNALRRTLLSSIEGAAVTAIRIEGVLHEFQSITGVVEDATDIILNLKQVPFKLAGEGPKALYLRADQPGVVTSGMIEADGDVEILDKNIYLATLSEGGKLDMEVRKMVSAGYATAKGILSENRETLILIAKALIEREVLDASEIKLLVEGQALPPLKPLQAKNRRRRSAGNQAGAGACQRRRASSDSVGRFLAPFLSFISKRLWLCLHFLQRP